MPTRKATTGLKMPPFALQPGDGRPLTRQVVDGPCRDPEFPVPAKPPRTACVPVIEAL